jgi:hypothetical protein
MRRPNFNRANGDALFFALISKISPERQYLAAWKFPFSDTIATSLYGHCIIENSLVGDESNVCSNYPEVVMSPAQSPLFLF